MSRKEINLKSIFQELNLHIQINYNQKGIQSVLLHPSEKKFKWSFFSHHSNPNLEALIQKWLETYCQKIASPILLPFDWTCLPSFTQQVLQIISLIPFGTFFTYQQVAHLLGRPSAARAVGGACRRNPFPLFIPCHRVLGTKLELKGFSAGGISVKRKILIFEGVKLD